MKFKKFFSSGRNVFLGVVGLSALSGALLLQTQGIADTHIQSNQILVSSEIVGDRASSDIIENNISVQAVRNLEEDLQIKRVFEESYNKGCDAEYADFSMKEFFAVEKVVKQANQELQLLNDSQTVSGNDVLDKVDTVTAKYQTLEKFKTGIDRENFLKNIQAVKDANKVLGECLDKSKTKRI